MVIRDCMYCDGREGGCAQCNYTGAAPSTPAEMRQMRRDANAVLTDNSEGCIVTYKETCSCVVRMPQGGTVEVQLEEGSTVEVGDKGKLVVKYERLHFKPE